MSDPTTDISSESSREGRARILHSYTACSLLAVGKDGRGRRRGMSGARTFREELVGDVKELEKLVRTLTANSLLKQTRNQARALVTSCLTYTSSQIQDHPHS